MQEILQDKIKELNSYITKAEHSLQKAPEGTLVLSKSNGTVQYEGKEFSDDTPVLTTERGERVRSKTEKILADKFFSLGIPYRYEHPVSLKGYGTVYPDFKLLNIRERKEVYLEHFGMMDNSEYCQKAIQKLENYAKNGIYIGKNLLVTFETLRKPLNMKIVEQMLKEFIL